MVQSKYKHLAMLTGFAGQWPCAAKKHRVVTLPFASFVSKQKK
jgi:hypothetical protein